MGAFENAQDLFASYEQEGQFIKLREAIDILDEIIEEDGPDIGRAKNFKDVIKRKTFKQVKDIFAKGNVADFGKDLKNYTDQDILLEKLARLLYDVLSAEDGNKLIELLDIMKKL